jgi:hypothetical protein
MTPRSARLNGDARSCGVGSDGAAHAAIEALNDKEHNGRRLAVNEARPREERGGRCGYDWRGGGGGRGGYGRR